MLQNRSIPRATVIPELVYADVIEAAAWLCEAFGFTIRIGMGSHRAQLNAGDGAVIVREPRANEVGVPMNAGHSVMVRVEDVDAHCERAKAHGARITKALETYPYGERQYNVEDPGGHRWTFTQSVADVHPSEWGGEAGKL
jgi:uncharacterized glyoxalase superfamily protein PhnB